MPHPSDRLRSMPRCTVLDDSGRKGYDHWDYRIMAAVVGTVRGAARRMGVNRKTFKEMCQIHDIYVESCGGVPGSGPDYR